LSQQKIAEKHKVSKGAVNKICKGVEQDVASIVTAGVQYQQALSQHDDRIVNAVSKTVDEISKRLNFFRGANMLVARTVVSKVQTDGTNASYQDLNAAATALGRAQESVVGKLQKNFDTNTVQGEQRHLPVCSPEQLRAINSMLESQC
jgi:transcriptional regulator with XRE-family HTH domain